MSRYSRYLGQHFLINKNKLRKIADALELKGGDIVIEIGPGHGELTKELRIKNKELRIIAIEKDKELARSLKEKFSQDKNIEIIEGDALKTLPRLIQNSEPRIKNFKIVGNIPYYITGYLFRIIGELGNKPSLIIFLIQKEVAERICAEPPKMNLLAASVQFWAKPEIIGYVSRKDFSPPPKVESAIIKITIYDRQPTEKNAEIYYRFIKIIFKQPRKTILNNLRLITNDKQLLIKKLESIGVEPNARPQDLNIEEIKKISENLPHRA